MSLIQSLKYKDGISYIIYLIKEGADANSEDREGRTALMISSGIEHNITANIPAMRVLIENGANVNAIGGRYNITPLIAASGWMNRANSQAIQLLIEYGANVNAVNIYGNTSLMYSAGIQRDGMENLEAFKLLLENGADINILNIRGHTVFTFLHAYNTPNLHLFQLVINQHYRKEMIIYTKVIKNSSEIKTTTGKFLKIISHKSRINWLMHINSFLSIDIKPN